MRKKCPKCGNEFFNVTAHVTQGWLVDGDGDYITTTEECEEVTHWPDDDDIWNCSYCHYSHAGSKFNVE